MSVAERLKEEMKYSNLIDEKIRKLETKSKVKKQINVNKIKTFDFQNEKNFLKDKE